MHIFSLFPCLEKWNAAVPLNVIFVRNFLSFFQILKQGLGKCLACYIIVKHLHASLPNCNHTWAEIFLTLDIILNAAFATYTLHLVATLPNTCDSCTYVLRNIFGHPEVAVLNRYLCPLFWILAVLWSEKPFDPWRWLCFDKEIRALCLRERFVETEMIFHTFVRSFFSMVPSVVTVYW